MSSKKKTIRIIGAIAALAALALLASCRGFFTGNTYTAISIDPTPSVPLGGTQSFQLFGTNSTTGAGNVQITKGVTWSVSSGTTGTAVFNNPTTALLTGTGVGSITVNAEYEGLTTSSTGVVYLTNISSICVSTSNSSGSCSTSTEDLSIGNAGQVSLYAIANYTNGSGQMQTIDITTSATWTITGPDASDLTCATTASPAVCTVAAGTTATGNNTVTVSYPQTSITGTNIINVTP